MEVYAHRRDSGDDERHGRQYDHRSLPLDNLPGLGRDVSTFVTLQPGVAPDGSVAGANQDQNSFMLDGGNNSSDMDGTQNTYTPSFAGDPIGWLGE